MAIPKVEKKVGWTIYGADERLSVRPAPVYNPDPSKSIFAPFSRFLAHGADIGAMPICARQEATELMKRYCAESDPFMVHALRSSENFRYLLPFTDRLRFEDDTATILYPASGYHVAPILELGEPLAKRHNLKKVEFVYTEIKGVYELRKLYKALDELVRSQPGWKFAGSLRLSYDNYTGDSPGGSFEEIIEIKTPSCTIVVRFKNATNGEDYYSDSDLNRSHIFIVHDITRPTGKRFIEEFVRDAVKRRTVNPHNLLIIAEDFVSERTRKKKTPQQTTQPPLGSMASVDLTPFPYGCSGDITEADRLVLKNFGFNHADRTDQAEIGAMGYLHPGLIKLFWLGYELQVRPKEGIVVAIPHYGDFGYSHLFFQEAVRAPVVSNTQNQETVKAELVEKLRHELGEIPVSQELDPHFMEHDGDMYIVNFTLPPTLYDPRLLDMFTSRKNIVLDESLQYELDEPGFPHAVIIQPK